ncbi:hypothetical protein CHX27_07140 [Flavobacterium aurantiibacter]|uniref:Uncharacterized protein n=1 Tax=Flavobacterium aurantiibacter TaxID=2023067 RepID=A0A255ZTV3_9FLAO|nr:hypothetical protein CHX27_07140 [Flavobacterium aurantiibacter]
MSKIVFYNNALPKKDSKIEQAPQKKVEQHAEEGFWKSYRRFHNEGKVWNHKRGHRVCVSVGLSLRRNVHGTCQHE